MKKYLVGGAVRDMFLGLPVKDRDWVVVGQTTQTMLELGYKQVGADFPVFLHPNTNEEHALARRERKIGPGYRGFVTTFDPTVTVEDDLRRRDLTINAIAQDPDTGEIVDPFGGLKDLRAGILRHVSEAFTEDPLRVLRVARFSARYRFNVAPETIMLMKKIVDNNELQHLTPERVWIELEKALITPYPLKFFDVLNQCNATNVVFPGLDYSGLKTAQLGETLLIHRLLLMFLAMAWDQSGEQLLVRLKAPANVIRLSKKINILLNNLERASLDKQHLLILLKALDGFRLPDDIFILSAVTDAINDSVINMQMDTVLASFKAARQVSFTSLTEDQRQMLRGPEIGKAIDQARLKVIYSLFNF